MKSKFPRSARIARVFTILFVLSALLVVNASPGSGETSSVRDVIVARLNDESINPVTARFLEDAIARGETEDAAVIIELDTPGGLLQSTRELVKVMLASRVPVITYIHPSGSRAASAGVFITLASHVAAMSPSTNIGAAHPVDISGKWPSPDELTSGSLTEKLTAPDTMSQKVMNDTLAWVEGIAKLRGRNVEWARAAVAESRSITAEEAVKLGVVDFIATDFPDLLQKLDGRTVKTAGGHDVVLHPAGVTPKYLDLTTRQRILNVLANPNVAYLLLLAGLAGLFYEATHPGLVVPGVGGAICLLLAAYALQMLPTNYAAILLMLAGLGLIGAEIKFHSYGLLTAGGAVCLVVGSLAMFSDPALKVSLSIILPVVASLVAILGMLVLLVIRSHGRPAMTGQASFTGEIAEVARALNPEGKVFFNGAYWNAVSETPVEAGAKVRIVGVNRLCLLVEKAE